MPPIIPLCKTKEKKTDFVVLGTVMPAPADVGLILMMKVK
jgi:hypothetical protein